VGRFIAASSPWRSQSSRERLELPPSPSQHWTNELVRVSEFTDPPFRLSNRRITLGAKIVAKFNRQITGAEGESVALRTCLAYQILELTHIARQLDLPQRF